MFPQRADRSLESLRNQAPRRCPTLPGKHKSARASKEETRIKINKNSVHLSAKTARRKSAPSLQCTLHASVRVQTAPFHDAEASQAHRAATPAQPARHEACNLNNRYSQCRCSAVCGCCGERSDRSRLSRNAGLSGNLNSRLVSQSPPLTLNIAVYISRVAVNDASQALRVSQLVRTRSLGMPQTRIRSLRN